MADITSDPFDTLFQGKGVIPDKFVVNYKAASTTATIQFHYIDETGASGTLGNAVALNKNRYQAQIVEIPLRPIYGFWFVIANTEDLLEINSIVLVTKHNAPITYSLN